MTILDQLFQKLRKSERKALIGYVTAGFPTKAAFKPLIGRLQKAGLDVLEIGVPFSDPVADGPTIQKSSQIALNNGVTLDWILKTLATMRGNTLPIVLMTYSNPIFTIGIERFCQRARESGVAGLIVPDLIPEEGKQFESAAAKNGLSLIYLAAPTTTPERLKRIGRATQGFLYGVSLTGITGARTSLPPHLSPFLRRLRKITTKPIALGFGISTPQQVRSLRRKVDGIIVGSALIRELEKSPGRAIAFVRSLQHALNPNGFKETAHAS